MKAESVYDIFLALEESEKQRFCKLLKKPMPKTETNWIHTWENLSKYLDGISIRTLQRYHKQRIISKYRFGRTVYFNRNEIDNALVKV